MYDVIKHRKSYQMLPPKWSFFVNDDHEGNVPHFIVLPVNPY